MFQRVAVLESVQGKIVLSPQLLGLLWVVALAVMAAAGASAVSAYQVRNLVVSVEKLASRMERHERMTIHEGGRYEINDVLRRTSALDHQPVREIPPPVEP